jgi:hypothetical protein
LSDFLIMKILLYSFAFSLSLFLCSFATVAYSQTFEENILYGDESFSELDYYGAAQYYNNALKLDSSSIKASWKYAEACRMFNNYKDAERYYMKVLDNDKNKKYPLCRFWLALMQKSNGDYNGAGENFRLYADENKAKDDYYSQKAKVEINACELARKITQSPLDVSIDHLLDAKVNTPYSEFNAVQLGDTAILFSALRPVVLGDIETFIPNTYASKIYIGWATQAGWSRVKEVEPKINLADYHNANVAISANQSKLYFTRGKMSNNPQLKTDIWFAANKNGKWGKPVKLNEKINLEGFTATQPALAEYKDYDVLYFVSDRPGGFGKLDIWYSIIKNGKYGDPVNLGSIINTPGDEITPFYRDSVQTLFFSSDWHPGLGGFDIFRSEGALNQWKTPENIGYPLNTSYNDIYFTINQVDNDGYFTSNRPGSLYIKSETCCNDIYYYEWRPTQRIEIVQKKEVKDTVDLEASIKQLLPLTLYFHNDEPDPNSTAISSKKNYKTTLSEYYDMKETYEVEYSKGLTGTAAQKAKKDIEDFFEDYVGHGFSQLKLFSQLLLMDLERGSRVKIMIKGYCSPLHSTEYNINLAKRRISSLRNYIYQFNEGVFLPYLDSTATNGGKLILLEDPIGENQSSPFVSDNPNDKRNSVYSRAAAFERKIQIILYESDPGKQTNAPKVPEMTFKETSTTFGTVVQGNNISHPFVFTNTGKADLIISSVEISCECTYVDYPREPIPPGKSGAVNILIKTADEEPGSYTQIVTVMSNATNGKIMLMLNDDIVPANKDKQ